MEIRSWPRSAHQRYFRRSTRFDGTATQEIVVTIIGTNDAPVVDDLSSDHDSTCNSSADGAVAINGAFSDVDLFDTHTVTVDWGDGSDPDQDNIIGETLTGVDQSNDTFEGSHTYESGGAFVITLTVDDGHGGSDTLTKTAFTQGTGLVGRTLYVIGTAGRGRCRHQTWQRWRLRRGTRSTDGQGETRQR